MHRVQRKPDSLVSNSVLDVLHADPKRLNANRYVYVCIKEAQSMDIELPRHVQMLNRISSNKTIGKMYDEATAMAQCVRKAGLGDSIGGRAPVTKVKTIKGLS